MKSHTLNVKHFKNILSSNVSSLQLQLKKINTLLLSNQEYKSVISSPNCFYTIPEIDSEHKIKHVTLNENTEKLHWTVTENNFVIPLLLNHSSLSTHLHMMHPPFHSDKLGSIAVTAIHKVEEMSVPCQGCLRIGFIY